LIKNGDVLRTLIEHVAELRADMGWLKKLVYIAVGSSMAAAFGVLGQIVLGMIRR